MKEQHDMFLTERVAACAALAFSKCPPTQSVLPLDWLVPFVLFFFHLFFCAAYPWTTDHCSQISLRIFQYFLSGKTSKVNGDDKWAFAKLKSTRKSTLGVTLTRWSVRNRKNLMIAIKRKNKYCSQKFSRIDDPIFQMIPSSCFWVSIMSTRSSWLNFALRNDEAVYWVSIGQQWLLLGGTKVVYIRQYQLILYGTGSVLGLYAFFY